MANSAGAFVKQWILAVLAGVIISQFSILVTTVYLHRGMTHRGIRFHKIADVFFRAMLWLTTGIISRQWIAVHRKHHAFTDKKGDPHSPYIEGFWKVQLFNYYYYFKEIRNKEVIRRYAADIKDDWFDKHVFKYSKTGLGISTALLCILLGWWGLLTAGLSMFLYVMLSSTINGLCHWVGYKNFENTAHNIQSLAFLVSGESLHNNHHAFPACPKLSMRKWEFDPAWPSIWVMEKFKLCRHGKTVSLDAPQVHPTLAARMFETPA